MYVKSDRARGAYTQPTRRAVRAPTSNLDLPLPPSALDRPSPNTPTPSPDSTRPGDCTPRCRAGSNTDAKQRGELLELGRGRVVDELVAHLDGVPRNEARIHRVTHRDSLPLSEEFVERFRHGRLAGCVELLGGRHVRGHLALGRHHQLVEH